MKVILGMGCDRNTALATLKEAVNITLQQAGLELNAVAGLATIDKKSDEQGLRQLAEQHGWPMHFYSAEQLARVEVPNPSEVVMKYMGTPAVAEAAAMLAANTNINDLIIEKNKYRGADDKNATVSIVRLNT